MRRHHHPAATAIRIVFCVALLGVVLGFVVKELWNVLMPPIFGWHVLSFWQALGLLLLCKILFGGFHRHGGHDRWKNRLRERWENMTPEEQEKFKQGMRCGRRPFAAPMEPQA